MRSLPLLPILALAVLPSSLAHLHPRDAALAARSAEAYAAPASFHHSNLFHHRREEALLDGEEYGSAHPFRRREVLLNEDAYADGAVLLGRRSFIEDDYCARSPYLSRRAAEQNAAVQKDGYRI